MNKFKALLVSLTAVALLFSACNKDEEDHHNNEAHITILTPTAGQQFGSQDTVIISGKIESDEQLHGYELIVRQKSDSSVKFTHNAHAHSTELEFSQKWAVNVHGHQDMELEVIPILDHDGNTSSKKVDFHCHGH